MKVEKYLVECMANGRNGMSEEEDKRKGSDTTPLKE
jgi:hypothetical protein